MAGNYNIEIVNSEKLYKGLRDLWCRVFGDEPEYVDAVYGTFGKGCDNDREGLPEIMGFVVATDSGKVVSALTCYRCGIYCDPAYDIWSGPEDDPGCRPDGMPVYVSYAICTDPEYRGLGLAGELTSYVRDLVLSHGCISVLSPAEESLEKFYENLGYRRFFTVQKRIAYPASAPGDDELAMLAGIFGSDDEAGEFNGFAPEMSIEPVDAVLYNKYREAFLADVPHVAMSGQMMELVELSGANGSGLRVINGGDAICAVEQFPDPSTGRNIEKTVSSDGDEEGKTGTDGGDDGTLILTELLINPMLAELSLEIDEEIASRLAEKYGARETRYRMPGEGRCQSMAAFPNSDHTAESDDPNRDLEGGCAGSNCSPYFGFPIE